MDNSKNKGIQDPNVVENQEKNIKEKHDKTKSDYSKTETNDSPQDNINNSNRIIVLLKKVIVLLKKNIKLATIIGIATIIGTVFTVWKAWPTSKADNLKAEIEQRSRVIVETFHPNDIQINALSTPDCLLIKDFQIASLRMVNGWEKIRTMEPIAEYNTNDLGMIINVITSRLDAINAFDTETQNVQTYIKEILEYGQKNNIRQYIPSAEKITLLYEKAGIRDNFFGNAKETMMSGVMALMQKYSANIKDVPKSEIVEAVAPLDELYNRKEVLDYVNILFMCIIELNTNYVDYLNYSKVKNN